MHTNTVQDTTKVFEEMKGNRLVDTILFDFRVFCISKLLELCVFLLFCMVLVVGGALSVLGGGVQ
eukprot:1753427-Amphidinium_carterae.1